MRRVGSVRALDLGPVTLWFKYSVSLCAPWLVFLVAYRTFTSFFYRTRIVALLEYADAPTPLNA